MRWRDADGQATVELLAFVPLMTAAALAAAAILSRAGADERAGEAARAGAMALLQDEDPAAAARGALAPGAVVGDTRAGREAAAEPGAGDQRGVLRERSRPRRRPGRRGGGPRGVAGEHGLPAQREQCRGDRQHRDQLDGGLAGLAAARSPEGGWIGAAGHDRSIAREAATRKDASATIACRKTRGTATASARRPGGRGLPSTRARRGTR